MNNKQLLIAIIFAALNAFFLAGMSLSAKLLGAYFGPIEVTFWRNIFSVAVLFLWLVYSKRLHNLKTERPGAHLLRSSIGTLGLVVGMWAVALMPLAETTVLFFTSPLFIVVLSHFILKERVGLPRFAAVFIGFCGVLIAIIPSLGSDTLPVLGVICGLIWAFSSACVDICLRWMGKTENSNATVFYFVLFGTLTTGMHWPFAEVQPNSFSWPAMLIVCALGATGVLALLFKTQSFRMAEASLLAPVAYTMLIWTVSFDYIFWNKVPSWNLIFGALIIFAAQIYIIRREYKHRKTQN